MPDTPRYGHAPIKMRHALDDFDDIQSVGDFFIGPEIDGKHYFSAAIPSEKSGGWTFIRLPVGNGAKPAQTPSWQWDGNREKPTLSPSIHTHGHWHGWIRNGEMVEA